MQHVVYLDNAATTYPKPRRVIQATAQSLTVCGGNPGRGTHRLAMASERLLFQTRKELADFFYTEPELVIFTPNATQAINTALKGVAFSLFQTGTIPHILISDMEHNAVYRPVASLAARRWASYSVFSTFPTEISPNTDAIMDGIRRKYRPNTKILVCAHSSNIVSSTLPIGEIGAFCRRHDIFLIVDAAQSAGHEEIDMERDSIDALCLPGHKGLYGPMGCGALLFSPSGVRRLPLLSTLMEGGNGYRSLDDAMGEELPERLEAGTPPTPAVAGLSEGIRFVRSIGLSHIRQKESDLFAEASEILRRFPAVRIISPSKSGSILSFRVDGVDSERVADELSMRNICVRAGYHCTALGHRTLGTTDGGTVRLSFGVLNREQDILDFGAAMRDFLPRGIV